MKDFVMRLAFLVCVLIIIPAIAVFVIIEKESTSSTTGSITVYDTENGKIFESDLEEYLVGVVAAEMPASFEQEALKAQAIAARGYSLRKINKDAPEHNGADMCTDYAHCQAYYSKDKMKSVWQSAYSENFKKISDCVKQTKGEYLSYNGEIASTVFHSCSDGKTENAVDVWGGAFPYLICVESPGDVEKNDYITEVRFAIDEFIKILDETFELNGSITPQNLSLSDMELTEGGNVDYFDVCGTRIKGTQARKAFELKSSSFTISKQDDEVIFTVYGSGHGVGMSQYGAQGMAKQGDDYGTILSHYYPGTELKNMYTKEK